MLAAKLRLRFADDRQSANAARRIGFKATDPAPLAGEQAAFEPGGRLGVVEPLLAVDVDKVDDGWNVVNRGNFQVGRHA